MTTTTEQPVNVNEAFAGEKLAQAERGRLAVEANRQRIADYDSGKTQAELDRRLADDIAAGKIQMIGQDRYEVLTGFDANEIFSVRRATRPGEMPLIQPETGLDYVDGMAKLYSAVPTWHNAPGAVVIPGGTTDVEQVMDAAGINYPVDKRPVHFYGSDGELREMDRFFVTVRGDTGAGLGVVGTDYTPIQPVDSMAFLQEVAGLGIPFESAGPLRGGRRIFISMRVPDAVVIDAEGIDERIEMYFALMDSFDGYSIYQTLISPWRPICGNTNRFASRDAVARWGTRHTKNAKERAAEARRTLLKVDAYSEAFAAEETALAQADLAMAKVDKLLAELFPEPEGKDGKAPTDLQRANYRAKLDKVMGYFQVECARVGQTAYAFENAVTGFADHDLRQAKPANMAAANATAVLEGADDRLKNAAHKRLLTLVNR